MKEVESAWLAENTDIEQKYPGEYVAISGRKVIAHGKILEDVLKEAEPVDPDPLIYKVLTRNILIV